MESKRKVNGGATASAEDVNDRSAKRRKLPVCLELFCIRLYAKGRVAVLLESICQGGQLPQCRRLENIKPFYAYRLPTTSSNE